MSTHAARAPNVATSEALRPVATVPAVEEAAGRWRLLIWAPWIALAVYATWRLGAGAALARHGVVNDLFYLPFCLLPALACARAGRLRQGRVGDAWRLIGVAWLVSFVGASCWLLSRAPGVPAAVEQAGSLLYNAYYLFMVAGLIRLVARPDGAATRARVLLESAIVVGACHALVWYFVVHPVASLADLNAHLFSVTVTYVGETAVLFAVSLALHSPSPTAVEFPLRVLGIGILTAAVADLASVRYELAPSVLTGQVTDLVLALSAALVTTAGALPPRLTPRLSRHPGGELLLRIVGHLPFLCAGLVSLLLLIELPRAGEPGSPVPALAIGATVLGGLVMVRLALAQWQAESEAEARASQEQRLHHAARLEMLGELAGSVAHDFNNLLSVLGGNVEELREDRANDAALDQIDEVTRRGRALCGQLLAFARREAPAARAIDLAEVPHAMAPLLERLISHRHALRVSAPHGLVTVVADPGRLELALMNLVVNARDAMPDGGGIAIVLDLVPAALRPDETRPRLARLAVRDTGTGMDEATRARAVEPFFTTKPSGRGTGLGLATVQRIARECGGEIAIESAPGKGTTVSVLLPLAPRGSSPAASTSLPVAASKAAEA